MFRKNEEPMTLTPTLRLEEFVNSDRHSKDTSK